MEMKKRNKATYLSNSRKLFDLWEDKIVETEAEIRKSKKRVSGRSNLIFFRFIPSPTNIAPANNKKKPISFCPLSHQGRKMNKKPQTININLE
jgi:hypothetical protein